MAVQSCLCGVDPIESREFANPAQDASDDASGRSAGMRRMPDPFRIRRRYPHLQD